MTSTPPSSATDPGTALIAALAECDFPRLAGMLTPDVRMRALIPPGLVEVSGAEAAAAKFSSWFGNAEAFELIGSGSDAVADRRHVFYRLRIKKPGDVPKLVEQHLLCALKGDRINALDLVCSGFRPDDVAENLASAVAGSRPGDPHTPAAHADGGLGPPQCRRSDMKNAKTAALIAVSAPRGMAPQDEGGRMKISTHTTRRLPRAIALAFVVVGLAVPAAASGSGQPPDVFARAVARHQAPPDVFERYVASHPYGTSAPATRGTSSPQGSTFITDTLGGSGHPQQAQGYRLITDTLAPGGFAPNEAAPTAPGFSWNDAGVGAGTALGALLVLLGGTLLVARRQGRLAI